MKLKQAIDKSSLSLIEISKRADIKYDTLYKYKSGKRNLTVKAAKALGKVLKINWYEFFENEEQEENI